MSNLQPPAHSEEVKVAFPAPHILLLTFNRPKSLNAMTPQMSDSLKRLLDWFENEPELWVVIVTGEGRLFCAGADLLQWNKNKQSGNSNEEGDIVGNAHGFGSISRRTSTKPIIAAVVGGAYGGGVEMILNCDLVVASEDAKFALPEVKRGVVAIQGGIPRLAHIAGHQLASEMLLLGRTVSAVEARDRFGFVNALAPARRVLPTALDMAKQIIANSPDAVQSTKRGLILTQKHNVFDTVSTHASSAESRRVYDGDNIKEGLKAFAEKRAPRWANPPKL
ncbi:enoyl-CoA hydratase/carnithine racemase [Panaeolus papilionaceus]|nr:enoyl-CoA hydratase/carnithine racemase [Panaeolus papilionaceus]